MYSDNLVFMSKLGSSSKILLGANAAGHAYSDPARITKDRIACQDGGFEGSYYLCGQIVEADPNFEEDFAIHPAVAPRYATSSSRGVSSPCS